LSSAEQDLTGRIALVTGSAGLGIGTATARALGNRGATVIINGREPSAWPPPPGTCATPDVERSGSLPTSQCLPKYRTSSTDQRCGYPDILVHNAAAGCDNKRIDQLTHEEWNDDQVRS
jgi:NAD(P)-dependent dehydrogenase (short-subunit alcohol dehydrogenase family)